MKVDYMDRNVDIVDADFRPLANDERYPDPDGAKTDVMGSGKASNWKSTSEAPCPDDNKPANADSFAHRK